MPTPPLHVDSDAVDFQDLQARLRVQLDNDAPPVAVPEGLDLTDETNPEAVAVRQQQHNRAAAAALLLAGTVHALQVVGQHLAVSGLSFFLATGRAEWWICEARVQGADDESAFADDAPSEG